MIVGQVAKKGSEEFQLLHTLSTAVVLVRRGSVQMEEATNTTQVPCHAQ